MRQRRVCIVTPGHVASDPRAVKEADALHEEGYDVRVVAGCGAPDVVPLDRTLLAAAPWRYASVRYGSGLAYPMRRLLQEVARAAARAGIRGGLVDAWAHSALSRRLARLAARERADLYLGHCLAALPAVAWAARAWGSAYGFDAEDDHVGELEEGAANEVERRVRDRLFARYLPGCAHLTAASPGISARLAAGYGVDPTTILNVFPLAEAPPLAAGARDPARPLSLYWFSQTIGPGRGLEQVAAALPRTAAPMRLCVRGQPVAGFIETLRGLAGAKADSMCVLTSAAPRELATLASQHDVGLSIELNRPANRDMCLTNKIFTYLLAGIPMILSRTRAHAELAADLGDAAWCVNIDDARQVAALIDRLAATPELIERGRKAAGNLARSRFNWDCEKTAFLESVSAVFEGAPRR